MVRRRCPDRGVASVESGMNRVKKPDFARLEDRALVLGLAVLAGASVVTAIVNVPAAWQGPLVLAALLLIIRLLSPVEEIHTDVRYLRQAATSVKVELFPGIDEFYDQLRDAREEAASTLDLTHIRDDAPSDFGQGAALWSDSVVDWLTAKEGRSVRRVISARSESMKAWAKQLLQIQADVPAYHIRVVDWDIDAPAINMVIIDARVVFLAITGETTERTKALGIEDRVSGEYFSSYYTRLWNAGTDLSDWLTANP
jgi:hypothetical protein